jgi:hypothetical protein
MHRSSICSFIRLFTSERPLGRIYFENVITRNRLPKCRATSLSLSFDVLTADPSIEVRLYKPHSGSSKFYERDSTLLDQTSNEPFRATQPARCASNV